MAERLGAKFTIDISDLKTGIKTANDLIKQNEAAFQADVAEMGNWQKSEEGLRKRLDLLASKFDIQKKKVNDLIKERQRLIDEAKKQNKTDEEIAQITYQVNSMLDRETKALDSVRRETEKTEKSLDDLGKENDEAGKSAENASNGGFTVMKGALANLAAEGIKAAVNGLKKLAKAVVNAGARADDLNTLAKQSGFTTAELQKFDYAADLVDVSTADIVSSARKLKKNLTSTSSDVTAAFDQIGVSVRDESGELRNANDVFYEVVEGLSKVENETERDTLAMTLFGKGADDLAGIIDDGGAALREYGKEAEDLGIILGQDTLDKANEFNDSIDRIKATGKGLFAEIGAELAGELSPEIDSVRGTVQKLIKSGELKSFVKGAVEALKSVVKIAFDLGKAVLPVASKAVKFLADNFTKIAPIIGTVVGGLAAFKAALAIKSLIMGLTSPVGILAAGVSVLAGAFISAKSAQKDFFKDIPVLSEETTDLISSIKDSAKAFDERRVAADKAALAEDGNLKKTQDLYNELRELVDANGKVKEGYEDRVKAITEDLSEATGVEIRLNDGVIESYGKVAEAIEKTISKKKAESLLSVYNDVYSDAVKNIDEYEKAVVDAEAANAEAQIKAAEARRMIDEGNFESVADQERWLERVNEYEEAARKTKDALDEASKTYNQAREAIILYDQAQGEISSGETDAAISTLEGFRRKIDAVGSSFDENGQKQKASLEKSVSDARRYYNQLVDQYEREFDKLSEKEREFQEKRIQSAEKALTEAEAALEDFKKLGEESGRAFVEGTTNGVVEASSGSIFIEAAKKLYDKAGIVVPRIVKYDPSAPQRAASNETTGSSVVINQTNNYSAAHSRYEMYQSKADMLVALRLAQTEGY